MEEHKSINSSRCKRKTMEQNDGNNKIGLISEEIERERIAEKKKKELDWEKHRFESIRDAEMKLYKIPEHLDVDYLYKTKEFDNKYKEVQQEPTRRENL